MASGGAVGATRTQYSVWTGAGDPGHGRMKSHRPPLKAKKIPPTLTDLPRFPRFPETAGRAKIAE